jgi:DNA-3-methyladenine glycosylase I
MRACHDAEWGVPRYNGRALWGKLVLDGFQAGLSWSVVLHRRDARSRAFRGFDPEAVARFNEDDISRLLNDPGIIRSRAKVRAAVGNARAYLRMAEAGEDFPAFVRGMAGGGGPVHNTWRDAVDAPAKTPLSEQVSAELKRRGFTFVGPVIVYAWMQALGVANDHLSPAASATRRSAAPAQPDPRAPHAGGANVYKTAGLIYNHAEASRHIL